MNKELKNLTNKVVKLHECSKKGNRKIGYRMFKEAMAAILKLEANGVKSGLIKEAKAILSKYYDKYKATVAKDPTRVIVESKKPTAAEVAEMAEKAEAKEQKDTRKKLKEYHKELVNNVSHIKDAIMESDYERIQFHAQQIKKIADKFNFEADRWVNDYLE